MKSTKPDRPLQNPSNSPSPSSRGTEYDAIDALIARGDTSQRREPLSGANTTAPPSHPLSLTPGQGQSHSSPLPPPPPQRPLQVTGFPPAILPSRPPKTTRSSPPELSARPPPQPADPQVVKPRQDTERIPEPGRIPPGPSTMKKKDFLASTQEDHIYVDPPEQKGRLGSGQAVVSRDKVTTLSRSRRTYVSAGNRLDSLEANGSGSRRLRQ